MALAKRKKYTPAQYLALEEKAEYKSEFWNGEIVAMSGAMIDHQQIIMNISRILGNKLYGRCRLFASEMKVWVKKRDKFFYPDITVLCGEPIFYKKRRDSIVNPTLIVEILSAGTEAKDRGEKLLAYQSLKSLEEYVLISQDKSIVEQYVRNADENWIYKATIGLKSKVKLESIEVELTLEEIYQRVKL